MTTAGGTASGARSGRPRSASRPQGPKLLRWDNAPPQHLHRVWEAARAAGITLAFPPFRAPELMPLEDLWRQLMPVAAANRADADLDGFGGAHPDLARHHDPDRPPLPLRLRQFLS